MAQWNETQHARATNGTFREMAGSAPEGQLAAPAAPLPPDAYSTVAIDGGSCTVDDGWDQNCSCGNGSLVDWWASGDPDGTITMDAVSRADDADTIVCPNCGRVYRHGDVAVGTSTPPIARFDVTAGAFAAALDHQHRILFGEPRRPERSRS